MNARPTAEGQPVGLIIVDHGSRRDESNKMLEELAALFAGRFRQKYSIVEPAHMELAEPSIGTAYARCIERGARRVVVVPFFLGPGKHWTQDIPRLTAAAAASFPETQFHVSPTLGIDDLILDLLDKRATWCADHAYDCDLCHGTLRCGRNCEDIEEKCNRRGAEAQRTDAEKKVLSQIKMQMHTDEEDAST